MSTYVPSRRPVIETTLAGIDEPVFIPTFILPSYQPEIHDLEPREPREPRRTCPLTRRYWVYLPTITQFKTANSVSNSLTCVDSPRFVPWQADCSSTMLRKTPNRP